MGRTASLPRHWELHDWPVSAPADDFTVSGDTPVPGAPIRVRSERTTSRSRRTPARSRCMAHRTVRCARTVEGDRLRVWSHTQGVHPLTSLAEALAIESERIASPTSRAWGAMGTWRRRRRPGCCGPRTCRSRHTGAAEVDARNQHAWEPYGAPAVVRLAARLDKPGLIPTGHRRRGLPHDDDRSGRTAMGLLAAWHRSDPMEPRPRTRRTSRGPPQRPGHLFDRTARSSACGANGHCARRRCGHWGNTEFFRGRTPSLTSSRRAREWNRSGSPGALA